MTARAKRPVPPVVRARMHPAWRIHETIHLYATMAERHDAQWYDWNRGQWRSWGYRMRNPGEFAA